MRELRNRNFSTFYLKKEKEEEEILLISQGDSDSFLKNKN